MQISIYSTQVIATPPGGISGKGAYGGLENISYLLARYLDENKHEVNLFAPKESYKPKNGHLYSVGDAGTVNPVAAFKAYWENEKAKKALMDSDICIDFSWNYYLYGVANKLKHLCKSHHGPTPGFDHKNPPPVKKPNLMGVGFHHAKELMKMSGLVWYAVQNGIDVDAYKYNSKPISERERLLWVSRIYYPKGAHRAIAMADALEMPIDIIGGSFGDESISKPYVDYIKKTCKDSKYATFHGEVPFEKKAELYHNAKCVLMPIVQQLQTPEGSLMEWKEPFGLITPEANACGTPIVVAPNGGWSESMIHGVNGYFANSNAEFEYFIKRIDRIKPDDCRKMAERFDYKIMGKNYLNIFENIINGNVW